jgi:hypothetical protein
MSLDVKMEQMAQPLLAATRDLFKQQRFDYIIPYYKNMPFSQQLNAGTQYLLNLSNISGDVIIADFVIRKSYVGNDLIHYQPIANFQYQNQEGIGISGQQPTDDTMARDILYPRQNEGTFCKDRRWYRNVFAHDDDSVKSILQKGLKKGAYPFDNHCNLQINTISNAGVDEVWQLATNTAIPTSGTGYFAWNSPDQGTCISLPVSVADMVSPFTTLQGIIESMTNFDGTITVSGTWAGTLLFTFGGAYANQPLYNEGYSLELHMGTWNISGAPTQAFLFMQPGVSNSSVAGVLGIDSGSTFNIDVYATTTGVVSLLPDGSMKAYNS